MKKFLVLSFFLARCLFAVADSGVDPLPDPISNNAVALLKVRGNLLLFSFMGIGPRKTPDAVTNSGFFLDAKEGKWSAIRPVPGIAGRIGASAVGLHDHLFLFGGYVVDARGGTPVPDVGMYYPATNRWFRGADLPQP